MPRWFRHKRCHIAKRIRIKEAEDLAKTIATIVRKQPGDGFQEIMEMQALEFMLYEAAKDGIKILPRGSI